MLVFVVLAFAAACGREEPSAAPPAAPPAAVAPAPAPVPLAAPAAPTAKNATQAPATKAAPRVLSDQWYRRLQDGQPAGWSHVKWTPSTYEGTSTIHDRTEFFSSTTRRMGGSEDTFESRSYSDLERTDDGLVLKMEVRAVQGDRITESIQVWNGKGYDLTTRVAGLEEKHSVECDAPCPADSEAFLSKKLQAGAVTVGATFEYKAPNFEGKRLDTVTLRVEAKETLRLLCGEFECFRVVESVAGVPATSTWWLDTAGVVRKIHSGRSQTISTTQSQARDMREGGAVYSITVAADPEMKRCTSLDRAVIDVTLAPAEGVEMPDIPATPYSREVSRKGNVIRVELLSHDEPGAAIPLPVKDPAFAKHLLRTNLFCWDAPRVQSALKSAVGDEKDSREVVRKILRYVFLTLRKASGPIPEPTAVEILEDGGGDCSEHCVLFVTLCRAAGIPARRYSGYAQVGDMWGAHSFAEVWLGGWVGCDPTTNEYGTKARYFCFGPDDDPDSFPGIVSSRVSGRVSIRTVEFTEGDRTWKTDGLENSSEREDVLSGVSLAEPPKGWNATVTSSGEAHFVGPGVNGSLSVIAGYGDLTCEMLARQMMRGAKKVKFGGKDVLRDDMTVRGHVTVQMTIPTRRRMLSIRVRVDDAKKVDAAMAAVEKLLAPSL